MCNVYITYMQYYFEVLQINKANLFYFGITNLLVTNINCHTYYVVRVDLCIRGSTQMRKVMIENL